jgi:hypothetical protein
MLGPALHPPETLTAALPAPPALNPNRQSKDGSYVRPRYDFKASSAPRRAAPRRTRHAQRPQAQGARG